MTNIVSTATNLDHTSDAGFRAWVAEIVTALFTTLSLTQTADTGQINPATVNRPAPGASPGTSGGYVIGRFNDTLQSTSPIFFKIEFGTCSNGATVPQMWITVGTGSNGSGTITGTATARSSVTCGSVGVGSGVTCISLFAYNATQGVFTLMWKAGFITSNYGGVILSRSTDTTGAPTADSYILITNANTALASNASLGVAQSYSYLTSAFVSFPNANFWTTSMPFSSSSTLFNGNIQVCAGMQATPILGLNANFGAALASEVPTGVTLSVALLGTTPRTFLAAGTWFNSGNPGSTIVGTILILWQ